MEKFLQRILEINTRLSALDKELETASAERLAEIKSEVEKLNTERASLKVKMTEETRNAFNSGTPVPGINENREKTNEEIEKRARDLIQGRAISIGALDILHTEHQSNTLNPAFKQVSDLVDLIPVKPLIGGESYKKGYVKSYGTGGYTAEGALPTNSQPTYGYALIGKAKITAYTEVSEEFEKLAPAMYLDEVKKNLTTSIKRRLAIEFLKGDGASDHLTGIFSSNATAIEVAKDLSISVIDENTLDDIMFAYGGDEALSVGVLILSKSDLKSFAKVRGTDKKRVYNVDYSNKTIDGIPYVISSAVTPLSTAVAGDYVMAYGSLSNYEVTSFSPLEVKKSDDYKFAEGQICYKASGFFGGNVVSYNGFVRIKKAVA